MIDPEVARLRRLRDEALRVREIARRLSALPSTADHSLFARGACIAWRIARIVSGKLIAHPYPRYQKGAGMGSLVGNRMAAAFFGFAAKSRPQALKVFLAQLQSLSRQLDDARALTWSTEFSDSLGRCRVEIKSLMQTLELETQGVPIERSPLRPARADGPARTDRLVGELAQGLEGDWPYLAF